MSTERSDEEVPVMVRDFRGLRIEIGPRVQNEWRKVPIAEKSRLLESALAASEKLKQRFEYEPMSKVIEERQREEARVGLFHITAFWHKLNHPEQIELLNAFYQRDPLALHRIAAKWERQKKAAVKRQETAPERERERFHGLDNTLVYEWLNKDGLCLAWFSIGALEKLVRKAGLRAGETAAGVGQRARRLGLESLRPAIVRTSHVKANIVGSTVKIN